MFNNKPSQNRSGPYTKLQKSEVNEVKDSEEPRETYPSSDEYNFSVDLAGLIAYMG